MLVYRRKDLPDDPVFPADLEKLGYFINDQDQIRQIANPDESFRYKINANERWNEVHCSAFNDCIRHIVLSRLEALGMETLRLPVGAQTHEKHVPILHSTNISAAKRIIVVLGSPDQELGIWTYRSISEKGINVGSMVDFAKAVLQRDKDNTKEPNGEHDSIALVIANSGQLIYHCGSGTSMSRSTWFALPVASAAHPPLRQTYRNVVPGNTNWRKHVRYIFENVLAAGGEFVNANAKIDIIGVEEGGLAAVEYLGEHSICFARPLHNKRQLFNVEEQESADNGNSSDVEVGQTPGSFAKFLATRCRAYLLSDKPLEWPIPGTPEYGCNTHSSGEAVNHEDAVVSSWQAMLIWLDKLHYDPSHEEVEFIMEEVVDDEAWRKWQQREDEEDEEESSK
ncbi:hypothetical protein UA08_04283 [Talaromyces atroroseus]|uniref:Arb2 domain-containing protein n=1 Tax=Talaromyces atroroseus TaxID=1441469 RepID=A0A1Q5Q8T9_TALAT|nr:hypothetical protein UA08_04283 [Talaromyces atroroseus]OKL60525.1 hypothetical protein UA08_04283 [Talaromyces atroroseus]